MLLRAHIKYLNNIVVYLGSNNFFHFRICLTNIFWYSGIAVIVDVFMNLLIFCIYYKAMYSNTVCIYVNDNV